MTADFLVRREIYALASGTPARLVAEKIESDAQLRIAISEGCSLFQGYFFSQPILVESHHVPRNHSVYLSLLAQLQQGSTDLRKLEKIISGDAPSVFASCASPTPLCSIIPAPSTPSARRFS